MNKYFEILKEMKKKNVDATKLYILSCINTDNEDEAMAKTFYIYYAWLAIDDDICLPKLCTIVEENWEAILNSEFGLDEIKIILYD